MVRMIGAGCIVLLASGAFAADTETSATKTTADTEKTGTSPAFEDTSSTFTKSIEPGDFLPSPRYLRRYSRVGSSLKQSSLQSPKKDMGFNPVEAMDKHRENMKGAMELSNLPAGLLSETVYDIQAPTTGTLPVSPQYNAPKDEAPVAPYTSGEEEAQ
jgi:hypothetical protein